MKYAIALSLVCFIFVPQIILDIALIPRFVALSLFLLFVLYNFKSYFQNIKITIGLAFYFSYCLMNFISISWSINKAESIFDASKVFLGFCVFVFIIYALKFDFEKSIIRIIKVTISVALINFVISFIILLLLPDLQLDVINEAFIGFCGSKNSFTTFLSLLLPICFYGFCLLNGIWKKLSIVSVFGLLFICITLQTRSVWLCLIVVFTFFILYYLSHLKSFKAYFKPYHIIGFFILLGISVFAVYHLKSNPVELKSRFVSIANTSIENNGGSGRLFLWDKTISMIRENFWFGVGAGNWQIYFPKYSITGLYAAEFQYRNFVNPHNDFLWILSEVGIIGFSIFAIFIFGLFLNLLLQFIKQKEFTDNLFIFIIFCCLFTFFIISAFDFPRQRIEHIVYANIIFAIIYNIGNFKFLKNELNIKIPSNIIKPILFFVLFLILFIGIIRFRGEYYILKIYEARFNRDWSGMVKYCDIAENNFYTVDPAGMPVAWFRGTANSSIGNYNTTFDDFQQAYKQNPYNKNCVNDLGSAYEKLKQHEKAKELYYKALEISNNFDDSKLNLAAIYYNEGRYTEALKFVNSTSKDNMSLRKQQYLNAINSKLNEKQKNK